MKAIKTLVLISSLSAAVLGHAAIECTQVIPPNVRLAYLMKVNVAENGHTAQVIKAGHATELLETLTCTPREAKDRPSAPDLFCRSQLVDGGYRVSIWTRKDADGIMRGILQEVSKRGLSQGLEMGCH